MGGSRLVDGDISSAPTSADFRTVTRCRAARFRGVAAFGRILRRIPALDRSPDMARCSGNNRKTGPHAATRTKPFDASAHILPLTAMMEAPDVP
jgi:hypothetical protein